MTTTSAANGVGLLRAILADPSDDSLRLIMADWLEENGDPARGEFIRVQCELAKWACHACPEHGIPKRTRRKCQFCTFYRREVALRMHHESTWSGREFYQPMAEAEVAEFMRTGKPLRERDDFSEAGLRRMVRSCTYHRGFIESITLSCEAFLKHAQSLFQAAPITAVALTGKEPSAMPAYSTEEASTNSQHF